MSDVIAGRIELLDPLARGASGSLWRAIDRRFGAICAAKVMRQRDGADVLRFVREQTVGGSGSLGSHPHLLPPYTWVAEDDTIVLVMPLVRGGTLAGAVADHGPLSPSLVAQLLRQLLDALAAMHAASWVHRDVKPANLLLDHTGLGTPHLLLADFGIALHEDDVRLTATGLVYGTPGFMAPEAARGENSSASQDVWAAAACALEALQPLPPRERPSPEHALRRVDAVLTGSPDPGADALARLLRALLAEDPAQRPSAAQARDAIPLPDHAVEDWSRTADGERFEVFDQIEPLPPGSPGAGAALVPLNGPGDLAGISPSLHERITTRSAGPDPTPSTAPSSAPLQPPAQSQQPQPPQPQDQTPGPAPAPPGAELPTEKFQRIDTREDPWQQPHTPPQQFAPPQQHPPLPQHAPQPGRTSAPFPAPAPQQAPAGPSPAPAPAPLSPTSSSPAMTSSAASSPSPSSSRRGRWVGYVLLTISPLCLLGAGVLVIGAL
jgi:serine/threonine-protein kinase